jgi:hypothetical protein
MAGKEEVWRKSVPLRYYSLSSRIGLVAIETRKNLKKIREKRKHSNNFSIDQILPYKDDTLLLI